MDYRRDSYKYTYVERELAKVLERIWENRKQINTEDVLTLEQFADKSMLEDFGGVIVGKLSNYI